MKIVNYSMIYLLLTICLSSCELISQDDENTEEISEISMTSFEAMQLDGMLDNQENLIDEIRTAKEMNDRPQLLLLYNKFLELDHQFQSDFENQEAELSNGEILDLSNRHAQLIKRLPRI